MPPSRVGLPLAVTYPSAGNLGGGGFMVIRLANGQVVTNDHREKAPILATKDMYLDANAEVIAGLSTRSHLAAGVPGTVAGLIDVLEEFGTMPLADVIQPAIDLASEGFLMPEDLARQFESRIKDFSPYKASMGVFTKRVRRIRREICLFSLTYPGLCLVSSSSARRDFTTVKPPSR